jgi:CBS-domain-containing membrane protein
MYRHRREARAMLAKDLMVPLAEYLKPEMTLKEAAVVLRSAEGGRKIGVKGLPVLDQKGKMIGFLSIGDLLKAVFPPYMRLMNIGKFSWGTMAEDMARKVADQRVEAVMTTEIVTVPEDAPLMVCIDLMLRRGVKRMPVVAGHGWVVGILYEQDIFEALCDVMLSMNGEKRE